MTEQDVEATEPAEQPAAPTPEQIAAAAGADRQARNKAIGWAVGLVVIFGICVGVGVAKTNNSSPEDTRQAAAVRACESAVKDQLKAPSTAKFSGERYTDTDPQWLVTGEVTAENSFGVPLDSHFTCNLTRGDSDTDFTVTNALVA